MLLVYAVAVGTGAVGVCFSVGTGVVGVCCCCWYWCCWNVLLV